MTERTYLDAVLSDAAIRNGYVDLQSRHSDFFPGDAFGDRSGERKGMAVTLEFDGRSVETDIRIKSTETISPRTRFQRWFKSLRASPGDIIRIYRLDQRRYRLEHATHNGTSTLPSPASTPPAPSRVSNTNSASDMRARPALSAPSSVTQPTTGEISQGLVIADPWVDLILSGRKVWEIRGEPVSKRGPFAILRKGSGTIAGIVTLVDSKGPLSSAELRTTNHLHAVPVERFDGEYRYGTPYAWVLESPIRLPRPVPYRHPSGAVKWVNLDAPTLVALRSALTDTGTP